jgi:short subunit dehydrogenase-like uncharacterized protein
MYDLVLFGATGFVGRLTAEQLARQAPASGRIALAGRSQARVEAIRDALPDDAAQWPVLVADSDDDEALRKLAESARVVVTTVGPYARYGLPLVRACAAAGTHYADLTGEVLFMRRSIDAAHETARSTGARIVHTCGFDSVPSDLGVFALHREAAARGLGALTDVEFVVSLVGGVSGGTVASLSEQVAELRRDRSQIRVVLDPYSLSPDPVNEPKLGWQPDLHRPRRDRAARVFRGPFVMGAVNSRVVRRSNALAGYAYGPRLRYRESMVTGAGVRGALAAVGLLVGVPLVIAGYWLAPTRRLLDRLLPSPGDGPSEELQARGRFDVTLTGRTERGETLQLKISAEGDPGYRATAVMLSQAGLCLAFDGDQLPPAAGVLTPATAMGEPLIERLTAVGQRYRIVTP